MRLWGSLVCIFYVLEFTGKYKICYDKMHLLNAIELTPDGSSAVHIYTQTLRRPTELVWEECGTCPVFVSYTLIFVLQLRKKHRKPSVRVVQECHLAR